MVVALVVGDETHVIVHGDLVNLFVTALHNVNLLCGDNDIVEVEGKTAFVGHAITEVLDTIEEFASTSHTHSLDYAGNDVAERLLRDDGVNVAYFYRDNLIYDYTTYRSFYQTLHYIAHLIYVVYHNLNGGVYINTLLVVSDDGFFCAVESESFALCAGTQLGDVVKTKHHIL